MGENLPTFLLLALTGGLAAPLVPFAVRQGRRSVRGWRDAGLVAAITCTLLYVTFTPASLLGVTLAHPIFTIIVRPLLDLAGLKIGYGALAFLFIWIGLWALAVFCAACLASTRLNDWWSKRSS
jgi:hypothetical protein